MANIIVIRYRAIAIAFRIQQMNEKKKIDYYSCVSFTDRNFCVSPNKKN